MEESSADLLGGLSDVARRNRELMRLSRRREAFDTAEPEIRIFIDEVVAVGTRLGGEDERASAQNMLDYWYSRFSVLDEKRWLRERPVLRPYQPGDSQKVLAEKVAGRGNPFRSLGAIWRARDARLPGREDAIGETLELIEKSGIVFVVGAPGTGRSALVDGGVLWQLEHSSEPRCVFRANALGADPLAALAGCVPGVTTSEIAASPQQFRARFDIACGDSRGVLAVDNVEELFTGCGDQTKREAFAAAVAALCVPGADGRRNDAILILRDEWAKQVLALKAFAPFANTSRFTPPPPTASELQRAIELSAAPVGVTFEPGVVADLARELQGDIGAMALLQFMLMQLWQMSAGGRITWESYRKLGRPYDALTRVAEVTYAALGPEDQNAAHKMFLALTRPSLDDPGAGTVRSRRESRAVLEERGAGNALAAFEQAGLLHASSAFGTNDTITVVHDALMYRWDRLVSWLVDERRGTERRTTLVAAARLWQSSGRRPGYLITDQASVDEARQYASGAPELIDLIAASDAYVGRQRFLRRTSIGVLAGLVVLLVLASIPWWYPPLNGEYNYFKTRSLVQTFIAKDSSNAFNKDDPKVSPEKIKQLRQLAKENQDRHMTGRLAGYTINDLVLTNQALDFALDFSEATLKRPYMQRLKGKDPTAPVKATFSGATIEDGRFFGSLLVEAKFGDIEAKSSDCRLLSTLRGDYGKTSFAEAILVRADFSGCFIDNVSFENADLRDAKFVNTDFAGSVDFSGANLTGATFKGSKIQKAVFAGADLTNTDFSQSSLPLFTDSLTTTWWLASWGKRSIAPIAYNRDLASVGRRYISENLRLDLEVEQARALANDPPSFEKRTRTNKLGTALNEWAWLQATYGVQLEKARGFAAEAWELHGSQDLVIGDTLGYIDLQMGRLQDAERDYSFIGDAAIEGIVPSARYHYALVLAGLGRCDEAQKLIKGITSEGELIYSPTHERVLVPVPIPDPCPLVSKSLDRHN
ncbi:pentapeptide repeat-containing protein [Mesorhizobium sp. CO1-1-2]|uniref:pentapeptide repeat-containing protein n=1 Tax=Mesorhizobium sp. CO1-1-2 TaxID=2876635 RepID=UPI001CCEF30A|nr:pentapeptide repeat-containing protein [Mesorhizobium sp. CO1-1-2]MBZ9683340.1 pentapeptide repeat-containing protein [Mesorhizobium sp. CO1-1-2]